VKRGVILRQAFVAARRRQVLMFLAPQIEIHRLELVAPALLRRCAGCHEKYQTENRQAASHRRLRSITRDIDTTYGDAGRRSQPTAELRVI
jgi:hypothetical protein